MYTALRELLLGMSFLRIWL